MSALCIGCAAPRDDGVRAAVQDFAAALAARDGERVCDVLAEDTAAEVESTTDTTCAAGVLDEHVPEPGPVEDVELWGAQAQVKAANDTLFLSRFADGWKVVAAGCTPQPGRPYDCEVAG